MTGTHHLSLQDIFAIRDDIATHADTDDREFRFEMVNINGLISALTTPFQVTFGAPSFPTVVEKAAALTFLLIANHPFRDGNKRIASAALCLFLERNSMPLQATPPELEHFTFLVTTAHLRDERLVQWISERTHRLD